MRIVCLHSHDYARLTGGYVYNSRLVAALAAQVGDIAELSVAVAFPTIGQADRERILSHVEGLPAGSVLLADHLHIADLQQHLRTRRFRIVSVFHHARATEDHLNGLAADWQAERRSFEVCDVVIATSEATRDQLVSKLGVLPERILVALPGDDAASRSPGPASGARHILTVGAVIPRKRQDYLVEVAAAMRTGDWYWTMAGDLDRDPDYAGRVRAAIRAAGLAGAIELAGGVERAGMEQLWARTALLVAASHHEGYGMAVAEALRRGVPVVTTESGAVATWVEGGVTLASPDDPAGFAAIIDGLLGNPLALRQLSEEAFAFGATLPDWDQTFAGIGQRIAAALVAPSVAA